MISVDSIVKKIEKHFNFLYEKGFIMSNAEYVPELNGNWDVEFKSQNCFIYIVSDRDEITLDLAPVKYNNVNNRDSLERKIYTLSNGSVTVEPYKGNFAWGQKKQLERLSGLLKEYIDKIIEHYKNLN